MKTWFGRTGFPGEKGLSLCAYTTKGRLFASRGVRLPREKRRMSQGPRTLGHGGNGPAQARKTGDPEANTVKIYKNKRETKRFVHEIDNGLSILHAGSAAD